ncbi:hypothetical protein C4D60_Mb10t02470 [Musa balbisiana]|uniref:Dynamin-type G domain-containing protein n=1 Tax=Musa balbisiana TaxID=52838 RepID=A0A4S8IVH1_MUSBA|nr:hypothetical protein C4D60_Mb10t02470 [Musa balbisiana]
MPKPSTRAAEHDRMTDSAAPTSPAPSPGVGPIGHTVIPIVNKLQDIFAQLGSSSTMDLPQVAVVGSQSSGKSSVLEALVGRDFLPRGTDICTRRPLVLQLIHLPRRSEDGGAEWGEFRHLQGQRFYDFSEIRREIQIFSPNVLNITLVDLPGITKVPVGDQPRDIEAISPANADLANSDALQMARIADPDGSRTIGVITKLDIMDRGTDARNFLLGKDIDNNRSIIDALASEEHFFRNQPAYQDLSHCCGVPQLAKKLNQILVQHIMTVLPGLKSCINAQLVAVAKEYAAYGDVVESKEIDPCEDITDEDIRLAIQNATGPKSALFVPEVPFEVLVRRQISRLLDPSLQCAKFIYDELIKMSHRCLASELQRYPVLRRKMDEVISDFLRDGLHPAETMITHIIEMEYFIEHSGERIMKEKDMDYINTSHPNFIGGSKAVEVAQQQVRSSRPAVSVSKPKDGIDPDKLQASEKSLKSRGIFSRSVANGVISDHLQGVRPAVDSEKPGSTGATGSNWGISSIFGASEDRASAKQNSMNKSYNAPVQTLELSFSMIQLREPPIVLKPSENQTEQEALEIAITNDGKFDEMLKEPDDVTAKRKRLSETLRVLQQAHKTLDNIPLEAENVEKGYSLESNRASKN